MNIAHYHTLDDDNSTKFTLPYLHQALITGQGVDDRTRSSCTVHSISLIRGRCETACWCEAALPDIQ
uniref:Uncharacterized protein n=1 Tax=Anopheles albimanus TaxID=7167 RepID=A0A182FYJ1_ANOAL